jgi:predicted transcriptional regulator
MEAAKLTDKQFDCYSLVKEYGRPMKEVEQRMGITRKTIHEHVAGAQKAISLLGLREVRAKAAATRRHND